MADIALLGGTMDPFHLGHLAVAEQVRELLPAAQTWIVPAGDPPLHRPPVARAADRYAMALAGIDAQAGLRVLDIEVTRPGPSYTVDTMDQLAALHPGDQLCFVMGADAARSIRHWHRHAELLARHRMVVVNRDGCEPVSLEELHGIGFGAQTRLLQISSPPVAATLIRERAARGESLEGLVPDAVGALIRDRNIYGRRSPAVP